MRAINCSICENKYKEEEDRCPLLLQCGHTFCSDCLSTMFAATADSSLSCPRCRHVSTVGNSVSALIKNYAVLSLIQEGDEHNEEEEEEDDDENGENTSNGGVLIRVDDGFEGGRINLGVYNEMKLVRRIGEVSSSSRKGVEVWNAVVSGRGVRHKVAVKKVAIRDEMDAVLMQGQLEELTRKSMWCRNVCTFHGISRMDNSSLSIVMDRCYGSVQTAMQQNKGRLTLDQILRYGADIARGVAELHSAGVVCMSIKPSNLLLDGNGHAVVSDYGLPAILKKHDCRKAGKECGSSKIHSCIDCTVLCPNYTAPEAWEPESKPLHLFMDGTFGISPESDAWSFGCTLVEMCTGSIPWAGLSAEEIYQSAVRAKRQPPQYANVVGVGMPREIWTMIGDCLQFRASKRPTFHSMLATFLRHLQEVPRRPPTSPGEQGSQLNGFSANLVISGVATSLSMGFEFPQADPNLLFRLICEGNFGEVRKLLAETNSVNSASSLRTLVEAQNADGQTALHVACRRGSVELVEALLEYDEANADVLDKEGNSPLVFALVAGSPECVRALINHSANVRSRLREGLDPSVARVFDYHGQPDCIRELLLADTDPNTVDDEGESLLHKAIAKKYTDCAIVIMEHGGCKSMGFLNSQNLTPLHLCVTNWNIDVVKRWVELASWEEIAEAINIQGALGTALCMAAALKKDHESEGRELVRILLSAGADPTRQDAQHSQTVLHSAAMINDVELVRILLEAGVDVNIRSKQNTIPLHVALTRGSNSCIGLLLSAGANYNLQIRLAWSVT